MLQWYILHMHFLPGTIEGNRKISLKVPYYTNFQIFLSSRKRVKQLHMIIY